MLSTAYGRVIKTLIPTARSCKSLGIDSICCFSSLNAESSVPKSRCDVAVFWDLDNKPPKSTPPYEAAVKLRVAASSFGLINQMVAYANSHAFSYVPTVVREQRQERKMLNQLENKGLIRPSEAYFCRVCGRRFFNNEKLVNHFKQIHEREHQKRSNQIESARGSRRVRLVGKYSMKMEKYKRAARDVLTPKVGYGLADEIKRAGFWVKTVSNKPQAADLALRNHMTDVMDKRGADCLVLVSDDSDFLDVLREAKMRCLKTVVVGDLSDGALKRCADVGYSWREVLMGKAKKEVEKVVGKWKDRDVLKQLEWTYDPVVEKGKGVSGFRDLGFVVDDDDDDDDDDSDGDDDGDGDDEFEDGCGLDLVERGGVGAWWELDHDNGPVRLGVQRPVSSI